MFHHHTYLWGLSFLLIPLLIHLWYRKQGKEIPFGSIRFLVEDKFAKISRLKFNEKRLFLLRASIIILLIFLIAEPKLLFDFWKTEKKHITLIEEDIAADILKLNPTIGTHEIWHVNSEIEKGKTVWDKLQNLEKSEVQADTVSIFLRGRKKYFRGNIPSFSFPVNWHWIGEKNTSKRLVNAFLKDEQIQVWWSESDEQKQQIYSEIYDFEPPYFWTIGNEQLQAFSKQKGEWQLHFKTDSIKILPQTKITVNIQTTKKFSFEEKRVLAALEAIKKQAYIQLVEVDSLADFTFYIGISDTLNQKKAFSISHQKTGLKKVTFKEHDKYNYQLSFDPSEALALLDFEEKLPQILSEILLENHLNSSAITRADIRHLSAEEKEIIENRKSKETTVLSNTKLQQFLWWAIFLLIACERYWAIQKS